MTPLLLLGALASAAEPVILVLSDDATCLLCEDTRNALVQTKIAGGVRVLTQPELDSGAAKELRDLVNEGLPNPYDKWLAEDASGVIFGTNKTAVHRQDVERVLILQDDGASTRFTLYPPPARTGTLHRSRLYERPSVLGKLLLELFSDKPDMPKATLSVCQDLGWGQRCRPAGSVVDVYPGAPVELDATGSQDVISGEDIEFSFAGMGQQWPSSFIRLDEEALPTGDSPMTLEVRDLAGQTASSSVTLRRAGLPTLEPAATHRPLQILDTTPYSIDRYPLDEQKEVGNQGTSRATAIVVSPGRPEGRVGGALRFAVAADDGTATYQWRYVAGPPLRCDQVRQESHENCRTDGTLLVETKGPSLTVDARLPGGYTFEVRRIRDQVPSTPATVSVEAAYTTRTTRPAVGFLRGDHAYGGGLEMVPGAPTLTAFVTAGDTAFQLRGDLGMVLPSLDAFEARAAGGSAEVDGLLFVGGIPTPRGIEHRDIAWRLRGQPVGGLGVGGRWGESACLYAVARQGVEVRIDRSIFTPMLIEHLDAGGITLGLGIDVGLRAADARGLSAGYTHSRDRLVVLSDTVTRREQPHAALAQATKAAALPNVAIALTATADRGFLYLAGAGVEQKLATLRIQGLGYDQTRVATLRMDEDGTLPDDWARLLEARKGGVVVLSWERFHAGSDPIAVEWDGQTVFEGVPPTNGAVHYGDTEKDDLKILLEQVRKDFPPPS